VKNPLSTLKTTPTAHPCLMKIPTLLATTTESTLLFIPTVTLDLLNEDLEQEEEDDDDDADEDEDEEAKAVAKEPR